MTTLKGTKRYNSEKMEELCKRDHYSCGSNNYAGTTTLKRASDGTLWEETWGNGQTFHVTDNLIPFDGDLSMYNPNDKQAKRMIEINIIQEVE